MKKLVDLTIVIVSYNTRDLLHTCLTSVTRAMAKNAWEIIVVDNASTDGSVQMVKRDFPDVRVLDNSQNEGFARANNMGLRKGLGKYLLLLNSDTEIPKGTIEAVQVFLDQHPDGGVCTCKVLLPDGSIDPACHRGFPTPWASLTYFTGLERLFPHSKLFARYHQWYKGIDSVHEIDSPMGAFYMIRRDVIDSVGYLDEDYFMYGEDLDWSYRIKQAGWKIYYYPLVTVLHKKKQSGRESGDPALRQKTQRYFYETMKLFYKKHYSHRYSPLITSLVQFGIKLRALI